MGTGKEMKHGWELGSPTKHVTIPPSAPGSSYTKGVGFTLSAALVDQEEESFSPKLAISLVYADGTVALNIDNSQLPGPIRFRERERERKRLQEGRKRDWLFG